MLTRWNPWRILDWTRKSGRRTNPMRRPPRKRPMSTCVGRDGDLSPSAQRRWMDIPKNPLPPGSSRREKLRSLPPGFAKVPPAHFTDRKSARRGCRGRRGTRGLLQREISTGVQQFGWRHSAWGNVPPLSGVREAWGHFLPRSHRALQGWTHRAPPRSRDPHVWCLWAVLILGDRPLRSKTCVINDTVELYCPWSKSLPLTARALSHGDPTERVFNFSCRDFLVVWDKEIEATRLGDFIQPLVAYKTQHSGPSIDAALCTQTRKEIKYGDRWTSDRSVLRYERRVRPHKSFHRLPATYRAYALQRENILHKAISGSTPVTKCLPFGESVSAQAPAWRILRGAVQWCMQSWTKNSAAWLPCWLVSSQFRINGSSQAPFRCSDWQCALCSSLSILCLLVTLSRITRGSRML